MFELDRVVAQLIHQASQLIKVSLLQHLAPEPRGTRWLILHRITQVVQHVMKRPPIAVDEIAAVVLFLQRVAPTKHRAEHRVLRLACLEGGEPGRKLRATDIDRNLSAREGVRRCDRGLLFLPRGAVLRDARRLLLGLQQDGLGLLSRRGDDLVRLGPRLLLRQACSLLRGGLELRRLRLCIRLDFGHLRARVALGLGVRVVRLQRQGGQDPADPLSERVDLLSPGLELLVLLTVHRLELIGGSNDLSSEALAVRLCPTCPEAVVVVCASVLLLCVVVVWPQAYGHDPGCGNILSHAVLEQHVHSIALALVAYHSEHNSRVRCLALLFVRRMGSVVVGLERRRMGSVVVGLDQHWTDCVRGGVSQAPALERRNPLVLVPRPQLLLQLVHLLRLRGPHLQRELERQQPLLPQRHVCVLEDRLRRRLEVHRRAAVSSRQYCSG